MKVIRFVCFSIGLILLSITNAALAGIGGIGMGLFSDEVPIDDSGQ